VQVSEAPEREKGGDDTSWTSVNLTRKNEENSHDRFS
jgi:hypothetical protein